MSLQLNMFKANRMFKFTYFQWISRKFCNQWKKTALSYAFMPGESILLDSTLGQIVDKNASEVGDNIAFILPQQDIRKSYADFQNDVNKLASGLIALGLQKGDRIGLCAPNIYEWPLTQFATAKAGLILVNINPAYQASELKYCLNKVGCKALITSETYKSQNFYDMLCSFIPEIPNSKPGNLNAAEVKSLQTIIMLSENAKSGTLSFHEIVGAGDSKSDKLLGRMEKLVQFDDPVNIQFTSGTTGNAKGAVLTHHNIVNNAWVSGRRSKYHIQKCILCCQVPLYHCFGCVMGTLGSMIFQHTCVLPSANFDVEASIRSIENEGCTTIYGTPTMFVDFLRLCKPHHKLDTLDHVIVGGASCPESVLMELKSKVGVSHLYNAYGSTENSPAVSVNLEGESFSTIVSGRMPLIEYVEAKIVDKENCVVPLGTDGELCTRGHILFMGYWDDEEKTNQVVDQHNWYYTGDLANMDEKGYIKIVGRKKDMVIRGGENLYPLEIENFLHKHPSVLEAHVCGVPDDRMGEELCAWVKLKDGKQLSEQEIKSYCKGKISHFKIPRYIMFVDDFPKTISGKIQKFKMQEISVKKLKL